MFTEIFCNSIMETSKGYTMIEFENNAYFWQKLDTLYLSSGYQITRKKGEVHPRFQNLIYPVDYGYINDTKSFGKDGVSVYAGSGNQYEISALVVAADILIKELDVKVLVGCTEEEVDQVLRFLNQTNYQKTVLIRKGNELPSWAETDI